MSSGLRRSRARRSRSAKWDGQLRQPIIVAGPDLPVSMSPQEGFLHEHAEVDTLGIDEPESKCKFQ